MNASHALAGFELRASIDRVVIEVRLGQPTQFRHVQDRMKAAGQGVQYVHQVNPHTVRTTIQNPTGPDALMRAVQALVSTPGSIRDTDISIIEVEVTLDARPTTPATANQIIDATMHLAHHHANPPGDFRIVRGAGHARGNTAPAAQEDFRRALRDGDNTINAGWYADAVKCEMGDPFRLRLYAKTYDSTPDDHYQALPQQQHTARIEAILSGELCPFRTVNEWRKFRFESLSLYFRQVCTTPGSELATLAMNWRASLGQPADTSKRKGHRRNSRRGTARDTALNRRIYKALTRLTARQFAEIRTPKSSEK